MGGGGGVLNVLVKFKNWLCLLTMLLYKVYVPCQILEMGP